MLEAPFALEDNSMKAGPETGRSLGLVRSLEVQYIGEF